MKNNKGKINWSILAIIILTPVYWIAFIMVVNALLNWLGK